MRTHNGMGNPKKSYFKITLLILDKIINFPYFLFYARLKNFSDNMIEIVNENITLLQGYVSKDDEIAIFN
jgi:hypothetical protein